jgi:hypothetical protein
MSRSAIFSEEGDAVSTARLLQWVIRVMFG